TRVYRIDYPLVVKLPQPEVSVARLDAQSPVAYLPDIAGIPGTFSFRPRTGDLNVASFQSERLLVELIERLPERLYVDARPHRLCCVRVKSAERLLIAIEQGRNGTRFGCERRCRRGTRRRRDRCGRRCRYNGARIFGPERRLVCPLSTGRRRCHGGGRS